MLPICRHILTSGRKCNSIALRGKNFCYHHDKLHIERRSSGLRSQIKTQTYDLATIPVPASPELYVEPNPPYPVSLEFPEEPAAILTNIYRVTNMLVRGQIDRPTANSVTYGMQVCLSALNGRPLLDPAPTPLQSRSSSEAAESDGYSEPAYSDPVSSPTSPATRPVHRVILTPDGDEIAPPAEILEDNEAEPIHNKGCPCLQCAEKYRNQPPEQHHPNCQCGLCEEHSSELSTHNSGNNIETEELGAPLKPGFGLSGNDPNPCHPERSEAQPRDLLLVDTGTTLGAPSLARPKVGNNDPDPCALTPKPRIARASALLSGSTSRDPLNRPWSVAEYTFGDAIRRHEAQYAARAAAALAAGIEPPPYEPFTTGLIPPGHPDYEEDQQMQQHSSEYWAAHFRKLIAERPDVQQYLEEEQATESSES